MCLPNLFSASTLMRWKVPKTSDLQARASTQSMRDTFGRQTLIGGLPIRTRERQSGSVQEMIYIAQARLSAPLRSYFQTIDMFCYGKQLQQPE